MFAPLKLLDALWALTTVLEVILLAVIFRRGLNRSHPAFSVYILAAVLQSISVACSSRYWGPQSIQNFNTFWGSQAVVVCARWLAVAEITRKVLAGYSGIWRMASRILFVLGLIILTYSIAASGNRWELGVLNADRAVELCMGAFIVCMFLFARYYRLAIANLERQLAIGFCLFSCTWIVNNSIFESWRDTLGVWWNFLGLLSFLASLALWFSAVRQPAEAKRPAASQPLSPEVYAQLSRQLNSRLHVLNNRLVHLFRSEDSRP